MVCAGGGGGGWLVPRISLSPSLCRCPQDTGKYKSNNQLTGGSARPRPWGRLSPLKEGHEATDTGLAYAPVSQAEGGGGGWERGSHDRPIT